MFCSIVFPRKCAPHDTDVITVYFKWL